MNAKYFYPFIPWGIFLESLSSLNTNGKACSSSPLLSCTFLLGPPKCKSDCGYLGPRAQTSYNVYVKDMSILLKVPKENSEPPV